MIVGIAVETTVDSKDASADTSSSDRVTARRRLGSKRGAGSADMSGRAYSRRGPSGSVLADVIEQDRLAGVEFNDVEVGREVEV